MYKKIMVAVDDSETSRCALVEAAHIARSSSARLYITHVADEALLNMHGHVLTRMADVDSASSTLTKAGQKLLDQAMQSVAGVDAEPLLLHANNRRVSETLADRASELGIDLIVIGRHGRRGLASLILGSVAEQLARIAGASVLLVRKH